MGLKNYWSILKKTFSEWSEDKASRLAAALAYYTIFSMAPLLIIVVAVASLFFQRSNVQQAMLTQIQSFIGPNGAKFLQGVMQNASFSGGSTLATIIGVVTLLIGATTVFAQLQEAMNVIWEVQLKPNQGILHTVQKRLLSFALVLVIGFLLVVFLVASTVIASLSSFFSGVLPGAGWIWQVVDFLISFGVITLLFGAIYKVLPDVKIGWEDVWVGAAVTELLFTIGKFLIGLYLGHSSVTSVYGAAGSLVVILIWVYYSAQILFLGAEFTQVYAQRYGKEIEPDDDAMPVTAKARAEQGMPRQDVGTSKTGQTSEPVIGLPIPGYAPAQKGSSFAGIAGAILVTAILGVLGLLSNRFGGTK